jgi:hypothetical protein
MNTAKLLFLRAVTGKISKLPSEIHEWINQSLENNVPYDQIIAGLAAKGFPGFNKNNVTRWRRTGYYRWLHRRERKEQLSALFRGAVATVQTARERDPASLADIQDRVLASEICHTLIDFDDFRQRYGSYPKQMFRLFRAQNEFTRHLVKNKRLAAKIRK